MVANAETASAPASRVAPQFGKPKSSLLAIFDRQRRQSLIWFFVAVLAWVWAVWDRHQLVEQLTRKREVVMIDSLGTYYVSPVVDIQEAKDLHAMQTKLACKALFERNPAGLDIDCHYLYTLRGQFGRRKFGESGPSERNLARSPRERRARLQRECRFGCRIA